jgi:hypothetical protein
MHHPRAAVILAMMMAALIPGMSEGRIPAAPEPNVDIASGWLHDLDNIWTPVGWPDHPCRFNVLFDGSLLIYSHRHQDKLPAYTWGRFSFKTPDRPVGSCGGDDRTVRQGWNDGAAPVLWSQWMRDVLVLRQEVFAHVPGGGEIATGQEPLYAWVRLSVHDVVEGMPGTDTAGFHLRFNAPAITLDMSRRWNMVFNPAESKYPRLLKGDGDGYDKGRGYRVLRDDGLAILAIPPGQDCWVELKQTSEVDTGLTINIGSKKGTHVDLLVPFLPAPKEALEAELKVGYAGALAEAEAFWSRRAASAAVFDVPEDYVSRLLRRSLQMAEVIAEKNPVNGQVSTLTGSWQYGWGLWATPNAMTLNLLDMMGMPATVEKYLEVFQAEQGSIKPPGPYYQMHPGYLSSPKTLTSVDWLSDHGALLWVMAQHALLTGDQAFIDRWLPVMLKACAFIRDSRRITGHDGVAGLLPPAVSTDLGNAMQAVWNDGWCHKGLITVVRLLERTGHPQAAEWAAEARDYRTTFAAAFRKQMAALPTWTDAQGKVHHQLPTALLGEQGWQLKHPFYLDTGPLFLVFAGLLDASDPAMQSGLAFMREGKQAKYFQPNSDWGQLPCLYHEMSSAEPCYSWNLFHTWQLGDRPRFLEGLYTLLTGAFSRQTFTMCETRGGITGLTPCTPVGLLARLAVVDDQIRDNELHLLRLAPLAWMSEKRPARFVSLPTEYGPIDLSFGLGAGGRELLVTYAGRLRRAPQKILLHVPPVQGLKKIIFNGAVLAWDGRAAVLPVED